MIILLFLIIPVFFCSCEPRKEKKLSTEKPSGSFSSPQAIKDSTTAKGIVHSKINCKKDSAINYALYLPSGYTVDKKYPVIYFFDSHAEGILPVEKYSTIAEKYGFILAASNNSKNGIPLELTRKLAVEMMFDAEQRFSIDSRRIYTGGFSGGARVASMVASENSLVAGMIGCGAGFADPSMKLPGNFIYIALSGNEDFNLIELKNLDRTLESSTSVHQLLVFPGRHEWPPAEIMNEAFIALQISSMQKNIIPRDESFVKDYINKQDQKIKKLLKEKQLVEAWILYRRLKTALYGIADISTYQQALVSIENSPDLIKALNKELDEEKAEINKQQTYSSALNSRNYNFLLKEISALQRQNSAMAQRLMGFLGLAVYMHISGNMDSENFIRSDKLPPDYFDHLSSLLTIYALLEPANPEHQYLYARLYAKQQKTELALSSLKKAVSLGFKDRARCEKDILFSGYKTTREFREIVESMY